MRRRYLLLMAAPLFLAAASPAPSVSLYGLSLGAPLSLKECESQGTAMCYQRLPGTLADTILPPKPGEFRSLRVFYATGALPRIADTNWLLVKVADGIIQEIAIGTKGVEAQQSAFDQLTEKFGKPGLFKPSQVQNAFGAKYDSIYAEWQNAGGVVKFFGTIQRIDGGLIVALTPLALKQYGQQTNEPKL